MRSFFRSLHIVLFPTSAVPSPNIFDAVIELVLIAVCIIACVSCRLRLAIAGRHSYLSANVLYAHSPFGQKNLRFLMIISTFNPWIGRSLNFRRYTLCTCFDSLLQYGHCALSCVDFTYTRMMSFSISCHSYAKCGSIRILSPAHYLIISLLFTFFNLFGKEPFTS